MKEQIKQEVLAEVRSWLTIQVRDEASPVIKDINQQINNLFNRNPK